MPASDGGEEVVKTRDWSQVEHVRRQSRGEHVSDFMMGLMDSKKRGTEAASPACGDRETWSTVNDEYFYSAFLLSFKAQSTLQAHKHVRTVMVAPLPNTVTNL